jgi:PIN domain nuclease of toxin-antitoxin system
VGRRSTDRLSAAARALLEDPANALAFSVASIWEIVIKHGLWRDDVRIEPRRLRRGLVDAGYREIAIESEHALAVSQLPPQHRDRFDRMLLAQAIAEGAVLLTVDPILAQYPGPTRLVSWLSGLVAIRLGV